MKHYTPEICLFGLLGAIVFAVIGALAYDSYNSTKVVEEALRLGATPLEARCIVASENDNICAIYASKVAPNVL